MSTSLIHPYDPPTAKPFMTTNASLAGQTALVTGASRGIGRAVALALAEAGAEVVVNYASSPDAADAVVAEITGAGGKAYALQANVADEEAVEGLIKTVLERSGRIDVLVNNAGITRDGLLMRMKTADWQEVINLNLTGVFHTVEATAPIMVEQGTGGAMVLISSVAGLVGLSGGEAGVLGYTAAKHGVVGLMRAYANSMAPHNIRVNSIHPSAVRTPMIDNEFMRQWVEDATGKTEIDMGNAMPVQFSEPEDIANAVAWLVSDDARYVTGVTLPVDAGYTNKR